jgi:hypothetical protein
MNEIQTFFLFIFCKDWISWQSDKRVSRWSYITDGPLSPLKKGEGKGRSAGPIQHCSLKADCTLALEIVPSFISRGAPHQAAREASTSEGTKLNTRILPAPRNLLQVLGSFTCPKVGTWGGLFNFPSEGRHAEDFCIWKIQRLRPGLNPRTRDCLHLDLKHSFVFFNFVKNAKNVVTQACYQRAIRVAIGLT